MASIPHLLALALAATLASATVQAQTAVCGDGVVDPSAGEACDEGPANGTPESCCTDTCELRVAGETCRPAGGPCDVPEACDGTGAVCPADATLPDGDGDGVCDTQDRCPLEPDPGQEDDDGDGLGNACDPCTDVVPVTTTKAVLKISKLSTPPGDDRFKLKATIAGVPSAPVLDPIARGLRIILSDALGTVLIDARLPGEQYATDLRAGWKGGGSGWSYANGGQVLPLIQGITKVALRGRSSQPGVYTIAVTGKNGSYTPGAGGLPLRTTVVLDPPLAITGQCGEISFAGFPGCSISANGSLLCRVT